MTILSLETAFIFSLRIVHHHAPRAAVRGVVSLCAGGDARFFELQQSEWITVSRQKFNGLRARQLQN
jgi:hypothetical protein